MWWKTNKNRKHLLRYFTDSFLPELANQRPSVIDNLVHCQCEIQRHNQRIEVTFPLGSLFDAIWRTAVEDGIELPHSANWRKDFKEFCLQLMFPWPDEAFARAGFKCFLVHKSNQHATTVYRISQNKGIDDH